MSPNPWSSVMMRMIFGRLPFKGFASAPMRVVIIAMIPKMNMNTFVQFQIIDPGHLLIVFCILTNDSKSETVSKKKQIWELTFEP